MLKRIVLFAMALGLCTGVTCTITGPGFPGGSITLDEADAVIAISQDVGDASASVVATIETSSGRTVDLDADQSVSVDATALVGPNDDDEYTASVGAASQYTITVREPTRGVEQTDIDAPTDFTITSPAAGGAASLSGFTLEWSGANNRLQVRIRLSQTLFGVTQRADFGPFTDTGTRELTAEDLRLFRQGANLEITVRKINTVNDVAGFNSGTATVEVTAASTASPRS